MIPNATRRFTPKHRFCSCTDRGLHFTTELLDALKAKGVKLAFVTLHVGLGTFRPVKEDGDHRPRSCTPSIMSWTR